MAKKKNKPEEMADVFYTEINKTSNNLSEPKPLTEALKRKLRKEMEEARKRA